LQDVLSGFRVFTQDVDAVGLADLETLEFKHVEGCERQFEVLKINSDWDEGVKHLDGARGHAQVQSERVGESCEGLRDRRKVTDCYVRVVLKA
jgi:hypothetical protein